MTFEVKYRNKQGEIDYLRLEAGSRSEVFAILRERGVSAIQVVEANGRSKPRSVTKPCLPMSSGVKGLAALIVCVVLGAAVYLVVSHDTPKVVVDGKTNGGTKTVSDFNAPSQSTQPRTTERGSDRVHHSETAQAVADQIPKVDVDSEAQVKDVSLEEERQKVRKRTFKEGTDQLIYLAVFASNGAPIPPLPKMTTRESDRFIESLRKPIDIPEDDPEHLKAIKLQVNEVRQQIAAIMAQEPDKELSDILNEHRETFNSNLNLRNAAEKHYTELLEEGDAEGAELYREKANELLEEYGAEPIESSQDTDEDNEQY